MPLFSLVIFAGIFPFLAWNNLKSLLIGAYDLTGFRAGIVNTRHDFRAGLVLGLVLVLCGMTIYTTATLAIVLGSRTPRWAKVKHFRRKVADRSACLGRDLHQCDFDSKRIYHPGAIQGLLDPQ